MRLIASSGGVVGETTPPEPVPPAVITFSVSGTSFEPFIAVSGGGAVDWAVGGATVSTSETPTIDTSSASEVVLTVTPGDALQSIVAGYTTEAQNDGGAAFASALRPLWTAQDVTGITGLQSAVGLQVLAACACPLMALDVSGIASLYDVELMYCASLATIDVTGCSGLRRLEVEFDALATLDLTGCAALEDLRAAAQDGGLDSVTLPATAPNWTHACMHTNDLGIESLPTDPIRFPLMKDVYAWDCGLTGNLDVTGLFPAGRFAQLRIANNAGLTGITVGANGAAGVHQLNAANCSLDVDALLVALAANPGSPIAYNGIDVSGNGAPGSTGLAAIASLEAVGWSVTYDTE